METRAEWIENLTKEVKAKQKRVKSLHNLGAHAIDNLRSLIKVDIDSINEQISTESGDEPFYITADDELGFTIHHENSNVKVEVILNPDDEQLVYELSSGLPQELFAMADKDGGISFFDGGNRLVTPEQLSQGLVDLLVRTAYQIQKRGK